MSSASATKRVTQRILLGGYYMASPSDNSTPATTTPSHYGPGGCVSTWKSAQGHCMMQTQCAKQDISQYVFSMLCIDQGGFATKNVFGAGSFAAEETFDTLIVCRRCAPDADNQAPPTPTTNSSKEEQPAASTDAAVPPTAGAITVMGQEATQAAEDVETLKKSQVVTQSQLRAVQAEVDELKVDLQSMNRAVTQLGQKVFAAPAVSAQQVAHTTQATSAVVVEKKQREGKTRRKTARRVDTVKRLRRQKRAHHAVRKIAVPRINDDGDVAESDDADGEEEDEEGDRDADGAEDAVTATQRAADDDGDSEDDDDDNTVAFKDIYDDDEADAGSGGQDPDDDRDDR